jgi:hypothetical protein
MTDYRFVATVEHGGETETLDTEGRGVPDVLRAIAANIPDDYTSPISIVISSGESEDE